MTLNICYKKNFLKQVISRVDFVAPIASIEKTLPPKLAKLASLDFPISEPADGVLKKFQLSPAGIEQSETPFKQWVFFGEEREKQLTVTASFLNVTYTRYTTYDEMEKHFSDLVREVAKEFPDVRASRFGLRFINVIEDIKLDSTAAWDKYIVPELLGTKAFFLPSESLTRLMHVAELKFGEMDLRFQFGMPNPDYPAVMKRPQFVLDFDAYVKTAHDLTDSASYVERAHDLIQGRWVCA
jgi:uncharacterized protein (TIGR04255 family)